MSDQVFKLIFQNQKVLKNLTDSDRLLLSYLYQNFASATTKAELLVRIDQIQNRFWRRLALRIYSFLRWPLNWAATAGVNAISDATSKALGISSQVSEDEIRVYFPDLPFKSDLSFNDVTASLRLIERFTQLVKKLGFGKTVVILDKLDEDQRLEGDADAIAEFIRPVVSDNNLLLSNEIQVIASIWSVPFTILKKKNIRTQKINVEILSWDHRDLQRALNNRLTAFSSGRIRNMEEILAEDVSDETKNKVFLLANKSPRDLWHAMDKILREQFRLDRLSKKVSTAGIEAGLRTFVEHFDYYEYYPRRAGSRSNTLDVYAYIRHLLKLSGKEFTRKQLTDRAGVAGGSASNYVNSMENMGLISTRGQDGGITVYSIRDPKIVFALENSLEIKADDR